MIDILIKLAPWLLQLVFVMGGLYAVFQRLRADVNGLGKRMRSEAALAQRRHVAVVAVMLLQRIPESEQYEAWNLVKILLAADNE